MGQDRLTRQELSWLLAQEARTAARALRKGVAPGANAPVEQPTVEIKTAPDVNTTLDALDASIGMLSELQTTPPAKGRRGRIDLASLLYDVAPKARITVEPGAGTEVWGDEADLRRMLHVLVSETGTPSEAAAPELHVRRDGTWVRIAVELGPDSSATTTMERRWLSRMAVRQGGKLEFEGGTQALLLPADASADEIEQLRKELDQAQQLGEAYARELAAALTADAPALDTAEVDDVPTDRGRYEAILGLSAALVRQLGHLFEELRNATAQASQLAGDNAALTQSLGRLTSAGYEIVGELKRVSECPLSEPPTEVDVSALVRTALEDAEARAARHSVTVESEVEDEISATSRPRALALAVRALLDQAIAASPQSTTVRVRLTKKDAGVRLSVEDAGPVVPQAQRTKLLTRETDPTSVGRPAGISLFVANAAAGHAEGRVQLSDGDDGGFRVNLDL